MFKLNAIVSGETPVDNARIKLILDLSISKLIDKDFEAENSFTAC